MFSFSDSIMLSGITETPCLQIGEYTLRFELDPPNAEFQEIARKELRETPEIQKESIARLRELLQGIIFPRTKVLQRNMQDARLDRKQRIAR